MATVWTGRALQAKNDDPEMIGLALLYPARERNSCAPGHHGYLWRADVVRIEGELRLLFGASIREAESSFIQALEIARNQRAKSFELRAALSMARLWRDQGELDEARELLAPVYGWFTEGFDTLDMNQAKALLTELA